MALHIHILTSTCFRTFLHSHVGNILIDNESGELVHIDLGRYSVLFFYTLCSPFLQLSCLRSPRSHSLHLLCSHVSLSGIAFDQGQLLPTPETVPFRLTRDMVDGMGVTGVEGVFRCCAEATLRVMRQNAEALLMLLEVFLFDPLGSWRMNEVKAHKVHPLHFVLSTSQVLHSHPSHTLHASTR